MQPGRRGRHDQDKLRSELRVLIVTSIVTPYRLPCFDALAAEADMELLVAFMRESDSRRPWSSPARSIEFPYVLLTSQGRLRLRALREILRFNPTHVIVGGWDRPFHLIAFLASSVLRRRKILWIESTPSDARRPSVLRHWLKRLLIRQAAAVLAAGTASSEYVRSLGDPRVYVAMNAIDNERFARPRPSAGDGTGRVLFVGRLVPEKGVDTLLEAWASVTAQCAAELVIVGSGPSRSGLMERARASGLQGIRWVPFLQPEELPSVYAAVDVFVLPSRSEAWGFVINEAMASGLAIVASRSVGAARDLVEEGRNGWLIEPGDAGMLARRVTEILKRPEEASRMGDESAKEIANVTPQRWAQGVATMIRETV